MLFRSNKIDLLKIKMNINTVEKSQKNIFDIFAAGRMSPFPRCISPQETNLLLDKVAISKIELGSSIAMMPTQSMTLLSTVEPSAISAFYLDTDYGLEYKADGIKTTLKNKNDFWDEKVKKFVSDVFPEEKIYEYEIGFAKIPKPPFKLIQPD